MENPQTHTLLPTGALPHKFGITDIYKTKFPVIVIF